MADGKRWVDTTTGIVTVNGVIVAVVSSVVTWLLTNAAALPWLALIGVFAAVAGFTFIVVSVARRRLRELIWVRPIKWISGLRVTTSKVRMAIEEAGHQRRSEEVAIERARSLQPAWKVSARDRLFGHTNLFWLENSGYEVFDVSLTCAPEYFTLEGEVFFGGGFGTNAPGGHVGKQFFGAPTERGRIEGVPFLVTWRDRNGDKCEREIFMPPEEILLGHDDAVEEARMNGWKEGYAARVEAEQSDASPSVKAVPPLPLPAPRWRIYRDSDDENKFHLQNTVKRSVAKEVRLESPNLGFWDGAHWEDASDVVLHDFHATFVDVDFSNDAIGVLVYWYDENHQQKWENLRLELEQPF